MVEIRQISEKCITLRLCDHEGIEENEEMGREIEIEDGDGGESVKLGLRLGNNANSFTARRGTA